MAKRDFFGGLAKFTVAAAAVAGVCYAFKDEIRGTKTYQDLNEKYDVDGKVEKAVAKAKETGINAKAKVKETAATVKSKVESNNIIPMKNSNTKISRHVPKRRI